VHVGRSQDLNSALEDLLAEFVTLPGGVSAHAAGT